eukprot:122273-Chlamydomonas_euryale.AAC.1
MHLSSARKGKVYIRPGLLNPTPLTPERHSPKRPQQPRNPRRTSTGRSKTGLGCGSCSWRTARTARRKCLTAPRSSAGWRPPPGSGSSASPHGSSGPHKSGTRS